MIKIENKNWSDNMFFVRHRKVNDTAYRYNTDFSETDVDVNFDTASSWP